MIKIKLKNKANRESSTPKKEPSTKPSFTSPKPIASFLKRKVPRAPIKNRVPPKVSSP